MVRKIFITALFVLFLLPTIASATVTVSISQSGADAGSVMAGRTFTVTASGWSGSCNSANLDLSNCGACNVSESQSKTISGSSVSWTTLTATKATSQSISVSVSGTCTPDSGSTSFDVKNAPSLSATVSPTSASVTQGSTFTLSLNIQNSGETTAQFGTIAVSPSDFSISSCSPSSIPGGQSIGITCRIAASSSAATGSRTVTLTIAPSNADSIAKTVSVTVNAAPSAPSEVSGITGHSVLLTITGKSVLPKVTVEKGKATITGMTVAAGKSTTVEIDDAEDISFRKIVVYAKNNISNMEIDITKLAGKPADITQEITGKVYHYIQVDKNVSDANIDKVAIKFEVDKNWITPNSIDKSTVALYRYSNNVWNKLETTKSSESTSSILYEAVSPGLSVFAISGEVKAAAPAPEEKKEIIPAVTRGALIIVIPVIVVMVAVVLFYLVKKRQR